MEEKRNEHELLARREAGVCMHITSLPGPYGIGEIGRHARDFIDAMKAMRLAVWQVLPLGPTAYGDSPYQPLSTFAGNEMLIDIADLVDLGLLRDDEVAELTTLSDRYVDYGDLIPLKTRLLWLAAKRFIEHPPTELLDACTKFCEQHNEAWLHDYALFRILKTRHGERPWPEWKPEYTRRDPAALKAVEKDEHDQIQSIKIIQFLFRHQWEQLRGYAHAADVRLFGDMPIYIALDSADAWANPDLLRIDEDGNPSHLAGVPPDYFSEDGQLWGNPLYDWQHHADNDYDWWVERLRATTELVDIVRIDHFRGFEAYWAIPADAETARTGAWEPGPNGQIFDALRREIGDLPIVAEDLGVITPAVEHLRDTYEMPGMEVLQFNVVDPDFRYDDISENSVCYTGTHDNDTTVGWFNSEETRHTRQAVLDFTGGQPESIHTDLVQAAFGSHSRLAIILIQDFLGLGSEARFNVPGTSCNNWRWRLNDAQLTPELRNDVAAMVSASGRGSTANGRPEPV